MSQELKEGVQLQVIVCLPDPNDGSAIFKVGSKGESGTVKKITVVEQYGQMAMVPWARVDPHDGEPILVNLANIESVVLADEDDQQEGSF